jgi:hypothetical protein
VIELACGWDWRRRKKGSFDDGKASEKTPGKPIATELPPVEHVERCRWRDMGIRFDWMQFAVLEIVSVGGWRRSCVEKKKRRAMR